jgi:SAM-dependent methyltransferase
MRQDHRTPFELALLRARASAYAPGEFVGQESFMTASEIRALATRAGIGPGVSVLDVGCGTGGPGRFLTRELGCDYLGVDFSPSAVALAREYAAGLPCRYAVAHAPPLPGGPVDVVLLLEAMLAIEDKDPLHRAVAAALAPGGRFAFTLEEGRPLTAAERAAMPDPDTVWLTPVDEVVESLERAGLVGGGPQRRTPRAGAGAHRRLYRRRRGHHRADRLPRARRHPRRPPAVGRLARLRAGAQARVGQRFRARLGATRGGSSGCFG